ncbi:aminotransferase class V-fold PLP-dependent enzyme [Nostoc sp.]|uniref:aminotransferase class V-fold PLP-dependent enzyme n=1 Tax=Nostoc sp. TaxID=1180 RepID=UPI002FFC9E2C
MTDIVAMGTKIKQEAAQLPLVAENCDSFWNKEIRPLFTDESLSFRVKTLKGNYVKYVNLDNGATTTPFATLKQHVDEMLDTYGSVHRGSGQKSIITTREYDASRNVIRDFVGGFDGRLVAEILAQEYGIGVRAGAFCTYEYIRKLKNISDEQDCKIAQEVDRGITRNIPSIIRASFAVYNTLEDCDRFIDAITQIARNGFAHYLPNYTQDEMTGVWTAIES